MSLFKKICFAFLFLFILIRFCFADDPAGLLSYPPNQILGFRGLDTRSTAPTIPDGRASSLLNIKLSAALDLKKRFGYSVINNTLDDGPLTSPAITGIFDTVFSNGNSWTIAFLGNKVKYDNSGTWTEISGASLTSSQDNLFQCIMALDNAVCTNDVDKPLKITSTPTRTFLDTSGLSSSLTKVKTEIWYRNFLVFGNTVEGGTERPTRFRWSNVGTTETWSDDDFVDISTFAGDEIIGFAELYGDLYIFLKKSIWRASLVGGDDVFNFSKVIDGIGAISRDSIQIVQLSDARTAVIFLDERKKVLLFDGAAVTDLGARIQPTLDDLNESRIQFSVSTFDGKGYYLSATTSSNSVNDTLFELQTEIFEWTKHDQIDANALAQVKDSSSQIKTYFGNYKSFIYWLDNPDQMNDVDGATGIVDSTGIVNTSTITGAQAILDSGLASGTYTGAVIRITSGTGVGAETIVATNLNGDTGVAVVTAFATTPDSTSVYSIGDIDASYTGKWYDLGSSTKEKSFLGFLIWGAEDTSNAVDVSYGIDFGSILETQTISLSPASSSLWDSAIWDESVWGVTGDKISTLKIKGFGNFIQPYFMNNSIDETFHLYGINILGVQGDTKQ